MWRLISMMVLRENVRNLKTLGDESLAYISSTNGLNLSRTQIPTVSSHKGICNLTRKYSLFCSFLWLMSWTVKAEWGNSLNQSTMSFCIFGDCLASITSSVLPIRNRAWDPSETMHAVCSFVIVILNKFKETDKMNGNAFVGWDLLCPKHYLISH